MVSWASCCLWSMKRNQNWIPSNGYFVITSVLFFTLIQWRISWTTVILSEAHCPETKPTWHGWIRCWRKGHIRLARLVLIPKISLPTNPIQHLQILVKTFIIIPFYNNIPIPSLFIMLWSCNFSMPYSCKVFQTSKP